MPDLGYGVDQRRGTYLHFDESGEYVVRFRANSNMQDEYIQKVVYLENSCEYQYTYDVESFSNKEVIIGNISFSKMEYENGD